MYLLFCSVVGSGIAYVSMIVADSEIEVVVVVGAPQWPCCCILLLSWLFLQGLGL